MPFFKKRKLKLVRADKLLEVHAFLNEIEQLKKKLDLLRTTLKPALTKLSSGKLTKEQEKHYRRIINNIVQQLDIIKTTLNADQNKTSTHEATLDEIETSIEDLREKLKGVKGLCSGISAECDEVLEDVELGRVA